MGKTLTGIKQMKHDRHSRLWCWKSSVRHLLVSGLESSSRRFSQCVDIVLQDKIVLQGRLKAAAAEAETEQRAAERDLERAAREKAQLGARLDAMSAATKQLRSERDALSHQLQHLSEDNTRLQVRCRPPWLTLAINIQMVNLPSLHSTAIVRVDALYTAKFSECFWSTRNWEGLDQMHCPSIWIC